MASGIFLILDDIAMLADDVAVATKIATKKTAAILGDDLAVNAEKATGFEQHRELAVIWAITKGSLKNKIIILPFAFILSSFAPWLIVYILIIGGLYLLYEGTEKIEEFLFHKNHQEKNIELLESTENNILDIEKKKIKSAVFTDFILSIEIIVIALGTVITQHLMVQIASTTFVAFVATFGVYGFVAMIVRMDNVGFWLIDKKYFKSGNFLISAMPRLIQLLSIVGTIAMLLVGGGILSHNIEIFHHYFIDTIPTIINEFLVGLVVGLVILTVTNLSIKIKKNISS